MKISFNKAVFAAMALLVVVLIGGCAKVKDLGVYDKTVPEDQLCTLEISGGLWVREFNGKKTSTHGWRYDNPEGSERYAIIKIPAGTHTLMAYFFMNDNKNDYSVRDLSISHNFTAGRTYRLIAQLHKENGDIQDSWTKSTASGTKSVSLKIVEK